MRAPQIALVGAPAARGLHLASTSALAALGRAALGLGLAYLVATAPLGQVVQAVGGVAILIGMLIAPISGLYALLVAVPFSPTIGLDGLEFSLSAVEPLAFLLLAVWAARGVVQGSIVVPRSALLGALFGLLCALLVASVGATSLPLAIKETLKWLLLALALLFTLVHVRTEPAIRAVLAVLFFTGAGQAFMGLVQFVAGYGPPTFALGGFMRAHGNFGQPNPFAGYLGTIFPLALAMGSIVHPGRFGLLARATAACTGLAILLSLSRGAWLGLVLALTAMALVWSPRTRRMVMPTSMAVVVLTLLGVVGALPPALADRVRSVTSNFGVFDARQVAPTSENHALVERMAHWQAGWEMFLDHPFLGVGPGNYPAVYDQYFLPGWRDPLGHAHNYYLNMAAEAGLLGLFALLLVLTVAFRALLRGLAADERRPTATDARRSSVVVPSSSFARALRVGLLGSLIVFCTHNLFDNLLVHGVGIQVGVLLGLIEGAPPR